MLDAQRTSIEADGTILMDIVPLFPFRPNSMMDKLISECFPFKDTQVGKLQLPRICRLVSQARV